jgi:hypothetical protein
MGLNLVSHIGKNIGNNEWDEEDILVYEERSNSRQKEFVQ